MDMILDLAEQNIVYIAMALAVLVVILLILTIVNITEPLCFINHFYNYVQSTITQRNHLDIYGMFAYYWYIELRK